MSSIRLVEIVVTRLCLSGPIASILESKFGCRVVTILGTFVCAFGFFISIWAPSVQFMYISFGVIGGKYTLTCVVVVWAFCRCVPCYIHCLAS